MRYLELSDSQKQEVGLWWPGARGGEGGDWGGEDGGWGEEDGAWGGEDVGWGEERTGSYYLVVRFSVLPNEKP